jgi:AraC-like DNA-binding protein
VDFTDPDAPVPLGAQVALWQVVAQATSDPGFGVRTGASARVRGFGLLGYAIYYSATLGAALRRLVRYHHLLTDAVQFTLTTSSQHHFAVAEGHPALGAGLPYAVDSRLASVVAGCREITGVEVVPAQVDFSYAQPLSILEHRRFFRCPLRFNQPVSKVVFQQRDLALPVTHADETLAGYLSTHAERTLRTLTTGSAFREEVRSTIWALLSEGPPTLHRVAVELQMPARTLQRRLEFDRTSLRLEIERIRKGMATAALRDRARPIEEIAFLLGYAEPSTFYRSFRRWTGKTPHQYRTASSRAGRRRHPVRQ